eukprot:358644-Chlamydomonas_euryale.AAC.6
MCARPSAATTASAAMALRVDGFRNWNRTFDGVRLGAGWALGWVSFVFEILLNAISEERRQTTLPKSAERR